MQRTNPIDGQFNNPGYEYLKLICLMKDAQVYDSLQGASLHFFPLLALQSARLAIEEYVDLVGRQIDPAWDETDHEIAIKERVARIYKKTGEPIDFNKGIWKEVLTLFDMAGHVHANPAKLKKSCEAEIPEMYRDIATKYPIHLSQAIAEEVVEALLDRSKFRTL